MKKNTAIILCVVIFLLVAAGCKGTRSVQISVKYTGTWSLVYKADNDTQTVSGTSDKVINLGKSVTSVSAEAAKADATGNTLTLKLIEAYEPGFLYLDSSETMETSTTCNPAITASFKHTFSE